MPSTDKARSSTASSVATRPTRSRVASSPRARLYSARIGTNACENAPSANSLRRILGRRNAASKASICKPAPNPTAFRLSRTRPVILESSVNALTVDSALSRFIAKRAYASPTRACAFPTRTSAFPARACAFHEPRGSGSEWVALTKRATGSGFGLRQIRKVAIMPGLFRVLHRTLGQAAFGSVGRRTHQRNNSRNQGFTNMANTVQARKRARQAEVRRQHNASLKSSLRTALKKVKKAIAGGDKAAATKEFKAQQSVIDRIADKKVVHKNTAWRNTARLAQAIKALP